MFACSGRAAQHAHACGGVLAVQFMAWDQKARNHVYARPPGFNRLEAHEFNYSEENQLIYQEGNISVFSNPAFHYDTPGPVSLRLEWKGLVIAYSGAHLGSHFPSLIAASGLIDHG